MPIEILMPALSPTMKEGNLAKWVKKEGDKIKAGEVIAEIETDKATMEVEAVDEGTLGKILIAEGTENVAVNSCIALILNDGEDKKTLENYVSANASKKVEEVKKVEEIKSTPIVDNSVNSTQNSTKNSSIDTGIVKDSPLAKRIAKEEGVVLSQIAGSGPRGRIIKDDVLGFVKNGGSRQGFVHRNPQEFYAVKNNNVRKVIAKRLLESKQTVPHFYLSVDCELETAVASAA